MCWSKLCVQFLRTDLCTTSNARCGRRVGAAQMAKILFTREMHCRNTVFKWCSCFREPQVYLKPSHHVPSAFTNPIVIHLCKPCSLVIVPTPSNKVVERYRRIAVIFTWRRRVLHCRVSIFIPQFSYVHKSDLWDPSFIKRYRILSIPSCRRIFLYRGSCLTKKLVFFLLMIEGKQNRSRQIFPDWTSTTYDSICSDTLENFPIGSVLASQECSFGGSG